MRFSPTLPLLVPILAMHACASPQGNADAPVAKEEATAPVASPAATANVPDPGETALPFTAARGSARYPSPDALASGSFRIVNGCVAFVYEGSNETALAILPPGSKSVRAANGTINLQVNGRAIAMDKRVSVAGGVIPEGRDAEYGLTLSVPARCPRLRFSVGEVK